MVEEYILEVGKNARFFNITYENSLLRKVEFFQDNHLDQANTEWFWRWVPISTRDLARLLKDGKCKVITKATDLSFQAFWDAYDYKVGKKGRAERLWTTMSGGEKALCLAAIPKYKYWLAVKSGIEKLYPETFLSQRRWENEFKVK